MSDVIDNKVVQLQLDNTDFEKNSKQSIKTLAQLEYAMNISTAETNKSLLEINKTLAAMPLQKIAEGVDATAKRFTLLGQIGFSVINNLTNQLTNMATRMTMNLTVGQKQAGFSEYQLKMNSTRTIMSATGRSIEDVNEQLEKLNEYADKTIYSFSDMTQNIGKFTNAGVKLEDAVDAIKGVSSLAAVSGANSEQASRAMYNFAQALGTGSVKLIDWKSISNATMDTMEFKNEILKTAEALGTIKKQGDKYISLLADPKSKKAKEEFTAENMQYALETGWFTSDVLIETLKKYTDEETELGKKAMEAATEVRTFSAMMDALKESSGSAWSKTFELIFGDMNEATQLWTAINDKITKMLDKFAAVRNIPLQILHDNGGRAYLKNIFSTLGKGIEGFVEPIKKAWREVFPPWPKTWLLELVQKLERFITSLKGDGEAMRAVGSIAKFFFGVIRVGLNLIKSMFKGLKIFSPAAKEAGGGARSLLISLGKLAEGANEKMKKMNYTISIADSLKNVLKGLCDIIVDVLQYFKKLVRESDSVGGAFKKLFNDISTGLSGIFNGTSGLPSNDASDFINGISDRLKKIFNAVVQLFKSDNYEEVNKIDSSLLQSVIIFIYNVFKRLEKLLTVVFDFIIKACKTLISKCIEAVKWVFSLPGSITVLMLAIALLIGIVITSINRVIKSLTSVPRGFGMKLATTNMASIISAISDVISNLMKFAIAISAIYVLFGEDVAQKALSTVKHLILTVGIMVAVIAGIGMIGQILLGKNVKSNLDFTKTQGISIKNNPLGFFSSIISTWQNGNVMASIISMATDFISKLGMFITMITVSLAIFANTYKGSPETMDKALSVMWALVAVAIIGMVSVMAASMRLFDKISKNDKLKADDLIKISTAMDNFSKIPTALGTFIAEVLISVALLAKVLGNAKVNNKEISTDLLGILVSVFTYIIILIGEIYGLIYKLNSLSADEDPKIVSKKQKNMIQIMDAVIKMLGAIIKPTISLLLIVTLCSISLSKHPDAPINQVILTLASIITLIMMGIKYLYGAVPDDEATSTNLQRKTKIIISLLKSLTNAFTKILSPLVKLSIAMLVVKAITGEDTYEFLTVSMASVATVMGMVLGGVVLLANTLQQYPVTKANADALNVITNMLSKLIEPLLKMFVVMASINLILNMYSSSHNKTIDNSSLYAMISALVVVMLGVRSIMELISDFIVTVSSTDMVDYRQIETFLSKVYPFFKLGFDLVSTIMNSIMTMVTITSVFGNTSNIGSTLLSVSLMLTVILYAVQTFLENYTELIVSLSKQVGVVSSGIIDSTLDILTTVFKQLSVLLILLNVLVISIAKHNINASDFIGVFTSISIASAAIYLFIENYAKLVLTISKQAGSVSEGIMKSTLDMLSSIFKQMVILLVLINTISISMSRNDIKIGDFIASVAVIALAATAMVSIIGISSLIFKEAKKVAGIDTSSIMDVISHLFVDILVLILLMNRISKSGLTVESFAGSAGVVALALGSLVSIVGISIMLFKMSKNLPSTDMLPLLSVISVLSVITMALIAFASHMSKSDADPAGVIVWLATFGVTFLAFAGTVVIAASILSAAKPLAVGAGITLAVLAAGFLAVILVGTTIAATIDYIASSINKLIEISKKRDELRAVASIMPEIAMNFASAIQWTVKMLADKADAIAFSIVYTFVIAPLNALAKSMPYIRKALIDIAVELVPIFDTVLPIVVTEIRIFLEEVIYAIVDLSEPIINALGVIIYNILIGLRNWIKPWVYALFEIIVSAVQALCDLISHSDILIDLLSDAFLSVLTGALNAMAPGLKVGDKLFGYIKQGLRKGTRARMKDLGEEMGYDVQLGFRNSLGIHSASRVFIKLGGYVVEGLSKGLVGSGSMLEGASDALVGKLTDTLGVDKIVGSITESFDGAFNTDDILGSAFGGQVDNLFGDFDLTKTLNLKVNVDDPDNALNILNNTDGYNSTSIDILGNATSGNSGSSEYGSAVANAVATGEARKSAVEEYRRRAAQYDDSTVVKLLDGMNSSIQTMGERMLNTQIVMDDGALVGEMKSPLDTELGNMSRLRSRERFATN